MNKNKLTPQESFKIITQVIDDAKNRFEENGIIYVMWGILIALASFSEYFLLQNGYGDIHYYPYFLMPIGVFISWFYYKNKRKNGRNHIEKLISKAWIIISSNILILGFIFASLLNENLNGIILILMGIGTIISGVSLNKKIVLTAGLFLNFAGFFCFTLESPTQPLFMGIISIIAVFIPGLILMLKHKK